MYARGAIWGYYLVCFIKHRQHSKYA